jgi:hypothetical protein
MQRTRPNRTWIAVAVGVAVLWLLVRGLATLEAQAEARGPRDRISDSALPAFSPSDEVSADQAVPFPRDI